MAHRTVKVNQTLAAIHNRRLTLRLLARHGLLSRKQLSDMTGMHGSTLSNIMSEFLEMGLVREVGKRESRGVGKKQTLVELNPDYGWVLGLGIHESVLDMTAVNIRGNTVEIGTADLEAGLDGLPDLIRAFQEHLSDMPGQMLGAGVGMPGIVDSDRGFVIRSEWLDVTGYSLGQVLRDEFDFSVTVENDAMVSTRAEALARQVTSEANFLYFHSNFLQDGDEYTIAGFGVGMFLSGSVYHGEHYGAGELSDPLKPEPLGGFTAEDMSLIANPDGDISNRLMRIPRWAAQRLKPLVTILDPGEVIMGGNLNWQNTRLLKMIEKAIGEEPGSFVSQFVRVSASRLPVHRVAYSASLTAIHDALERVVSETVEE